jgi:hypothetical protein
MQRRAVTLKFTDVSEVCTASIIKAMNFILTAMSALNLTLKFKKKSVFVLRTQRKYVLSDMTNFLSIR